MTDLRALIELVEKATGPSHWDLDYDIHVAMGWQDNDECGWSHKGRGEIDPDPGWPHYTASLDAVIALVERELPGRGLVLARGHIREDEPLWGAQICNIAMPEAVYAEAEHHTPALALLLAFLRAKEQT